MLVLNAFCSGRTGGHAFWRWMHFFVRCVPFGGLDWMSCINSGMYDVYQSTHGTDDLHDLYDLFPLYELSSRSFRTVG